MDNKTFVNLLSIGAFVTIMVTLIAVFHESPPNRQAIALQQYGERLAHAAINAHWQWQAENKPSMILLIHYNDEGKEIDRRPVRMAHTGWPDVPSNSKGCEKLWQMLLNEPMRADGYRVFGEYYHAENADGPRCRFRVASGDRFDYYVKTGATD